MELWASQHFYRIVSLVGQILAIIFWLSAWAWAASWASVSSYAGLGRYYNPWQGAYGGTAGVGAIVWLVPPLSISTQRTKLTNFPPQDPDHRPPRLLHPRRHRRLLQHRQPGRARPGQGRGPAPVPAAAPAVPAAARLPRPAAAALSPSAAGLPDPVNRDGSLVPNAGGVVSGFLLDGR